MASIGIGFLGEPAIASLLEDPLGDAISHGVSLAISLAIAYLITTALHITVGEQVPKIYAIVHAERTALRVARPLHWFRVGASARSSGRSTRPRTRCCAWSASTRAPSSRRSPAPRTSS